MRRDYGFLFLTVLFFFSHALGLLAASRIFSIEAAPVAQTGASSGIVFFGMLLVVTLLILLLHVLKWISIIRVWFLLALFVSLFFFFDAFVQGTIAAGIAIGIMALRYWNADTLIENTIVAIAFAGAGTFLGLLLGFVPALVLLVALSIYDVVAVFFTKHMVSLAEQGLSSDTFMGFSFPQPEEKDEDGDAVVGVGALGGGDVVVPLVFSVVVLREFGIVAAMFATLASGAGLAGLFTRIKKGAFYPALPVVNCGALIGFLLWLFLF